MMGLLRQSRKLFDAVHFPACFSELQQPNKHSYSLQLANHTQLVHHFIQNALGTLSIPYRLVKHALTEIALLIIHVAVPLT